MAAQHAPRVSPPSQGSLRVHGRRVRATTRLPRPASGPTDGGGLFSAHSLSERYEFRIEIRHGCMCRPSSPTTSRCTRRCRADKGKAGSRGGWGRGAPSADRCVTELQEGTVGMSQPPWEWGAPHYRGGHDDHRRSSITAPPICPVLFLSLSLPRSASLLYFSPHVVPVHSEQARRGAGLPRDLGLADRSGGPSLAARRGAVGGVCGAGWGWHRRLQCWMGVSSAGAVALASHPPLSARRRDIHARRAPRHRTTVSRPATSLPLAS